MAENRATKLLHVVTVDQSLAFFAGQFQYMRQRGIDVHFACSPGSRGEEFSRAQDVPVHAIPMTRSITPARDLISLRRLYALVREIRPTIVHAHTPKAGLLGVTAARLAKTPIVIYGVLGMPCTAATGARSAVLRQCERLSCGLAHCVTFVSHSNVEFAIDHALCPPSKANVPRNGSLNGVDAERAFDPALAGGDVRSGIRRELGIPKDAVVVAYVGRIVRDKGIEDLIDAWRELSLDREQACLLLQGNPEPQDPVSKQTADALRTMPGVRLSAWRNDMPSVYAAIDILVLPTYREGFPNVTLEASAMAIPVVATRVQGSVDSVVDGVTGTLVPAHDPAALAKAIATYVRDPELRQRHGMAGRDWVRRDFRQEDVWEAIHQHYCRLLSQHRGVGAWSSLAESTTKEDAT